MSRDAVGTLLEGGEMRFANALWINNTKFPAGDAGMYETTLWCDHGMKEKETRIDVVVAVGPDKHPAEFVGKVNQMVFCPRGSGDDAVVWKPAILENVEHRDDGTCQLTFSPDRGES